MIFQEVVHSIRTGEAVVTRKQILRSAYPMNAEAFRGPRLLRSG